MNKNLICLSVGLCLCAGAYPVMAQKSSSGPVTVTVSKQKQIEVKDYKSFKKYVADEEASLKTKPVTTDNGPIREKLKKMGIHIEEGRLSTMNDEKEVFVSPDKNGVAVVDRDGGGVSLFNAEGVLLKKVKLEKYPQGFIGFTRTKVFDFKGDFENRRGGIDIYDYSGKLAKTVRDSGIIDASMFSQDEKWFIVSSSDWSSRKSFLILYDMEGNEIWRRVIMSGYLPQIKFSGDDKYVSLKLPVYWKDVRDGRSRGAKWVYVFRVSDGNLISEENYAD